MLRILATFAVLVFGPAALFSARAFPPPGTTPRPPDTLPAGTLLMFDGRSVLLFDAPVNLPPGWENCGNIRISQDGGKSSPKTAHDYICAQKAK